MGAQLGPDARSDRPQVLVLISTPGFAESWAPLNIARIKAYLRGRGHDARALSLSVEFSDEVRREHRALVPIDKEIGEFGHSWHEVYFAGILFGHAAPGELIRGVLRDRYLNTDIHRTQLGFDETADPVDERKLDVEARRIERYCRAMHRFLLRRIDSVDWQRVAVAGFSCVEAQFLTSLFLARELRSRHPELRTVFGGPLFQAYNAEAFLKCFQEIDHMVVGEGELALDDILRALSSGRTPDRLYRRLAAPFSSDPIGRGAARLEQYPPPDYDDLKGVSLEGVSLTTYIGKGCSHWRCSFCGINERGQQVRPAAVVFDEIRHLARAYGTTSINFGDWEINGDPAELEKLCDMLIADGITLDAWAEINARNTSRRLLVKMRRAGIGSVQIGIESFSPGTLRHIHKPATLLDNVKVLKWGIEARMRVFFNILCNHPLSTREDVEYNLRVMRSIAHLLRPPVDFVLNEMELYRTSDMFQRADRYDIRGIQDYQYYQRCYPPDRLASPIPMFNVAYEKHRVDPLWEEVSEFVDGVRHRSVTLTMRRRAGGLRIYDSRRGRRETRRLEGLDAMVLWEAGERVVTVADLGLALDVTEGEIVVSLGRLAEADLVLDERGRFLALPISLGAQAAELPPPLVTAAAAAGAAGPA